MVVIPIYNLLLVPDANIYLKSDQYRHLARRYAEVNDRVVLLSCKKEQHCYRHSPYYHSHKCHMLLPLNTCYLQL